ncbi:hypothetical protein F5X68DRAFT_230428 [Plectosphaerella plurivora]|uniref:Uncharacterized protein n=1 Tax=Plectosphaerella plurivora TaxID=936078 RepID=A0A9P9AC39_9PEZI|nr:hypothetical protein F5X68DRAFT_230428 [Plectosphaerella plurivora]
MPAPGKINYCIVTTNHGLDRMLIEIHKQLELTRGPPALYFRLHGACSTLGWRGLISILTIYVAPIKKVYIVDVLSMCIGCFNFKSPTTKHSIKMILESPLFPKVFFDLRNDSNTLFITCGIEMNAAHDLQLMGRARYMAISESAATQSSDENIKESSDSITAEPNKAFSGSAGKPSPGESNKKNNVPIINPEVAKFRALYQTQERTQAAPPIPNGNADYFLQRPLRQGFVRQFLQPIVCRPQLWEMYYDLPAYYLECYTVWLGARIEWSRSPEYDPRRNAC